MLPRGKMFKTHINTKVLGVTKYKIKQINIPIFEVSRFKMFYLSQYCGYGALRMARVIKTFFPLTAKMCWANFMAICQLN